MLKMSKNYTTDQKIDRVNEVLDEVIFLYFVHFKFYFYILFFNFKFNLTKCKNYLIGYVDKKGISGGEKRRLAFASEVFSYYLLLNNKVYFNN